MKDSKKKLNRSQTMGRIKGKDTKVEVYLRKILWAKGYRYRKNYNKVFGTPDIVFLSKKIAVFCDSDFWHGKKLLEGKIPQNNREYWIKKLNKNMKRDKLVNATLKKEGWTVIRLWENDIYHNTESCIKRIEDALSQEEV